MIPWVRSRKLHPMVILAQGLCDLTEGWAIGLGRESKTRGDKVFFFFNFFVFNYYYHFMIQYHTSWFPLTPLQFPSPTYKFFNNKISGRDYSPWANVLQGPHGECWVHATDVKDTMVENYPQQARPRGIFCCMAGPGACLCSHLKAHPPTFAWIHDHPLRIL